MAVYTIREETGRAGSLLYNTVGVTFKKWSAKLATNYADATDSKDHDSTTHITWRSQRPGDTGMEGTIEGNVDLNGATASFVAAILAGQSMPAVFGYTDDVQFCHGNIDITDFDTGAEADGANMIGFTCSWKSNGKMTFPAATTGAPNYVSGTPGSTS